MARPSSFKAARNLEALPAKSAYVDGTFPEWRKVLPGGEPRPRQGKYPAGGDYCIGINPEYLAKFAGPKGDEGISFDWSDGTILVANSDPRFLGVVVGIIGGQTTAEIKARRDLFLLPAAPATRKEESAHV